MIPEIIKPLLALNRYLPSYLYLRVERRTFEGSNDYFYSCVFCFGQHLGTIDN
jgi:hypothetical protein